MKRLIYLFIIVYAAVACEQKTVGYLVVDNAVYDPDQMTICLASDLDPEEDSVRIRLQFPWVSPEIQGVLGTVPRQYYIDQVHTNDGDVESFLKYTRLRVGDGGFEIPYQHQIRKETYVIGVNIQNEGYAMTRDSLFTVIVK